MNKTIRSWAAVGLAATSLSVFAQQSGTLKVDYLGPGGHSSNNYGRTNAVHAASRSVIEIQKTLPAGSYVITTLTGGNSVNSIASDGLIEIRLTAASASAYQALVTAVTAAASAGAAAENAFRNVKVGDLTSGVPAWIRTTVTPL